MPNKMCLKTYDERLHRYIHSKKFLRDGIWHRVYAYGGSTGKGLAGFVFLIILKIINYE